MKPPAMFMPPAPTVRPAEVVRVLVMLLVPIIDKPPVVFAISPLAVTWVQLMALVVRDPVIVEFPVMAAPFAPTVNLSEVVRVPVMLLVPIIDKPPVVFAISPVAVTWVQVIALVVRLPVVVEFPVMVALPLVTTRAAELESPVQKIS